MRTRLLNLWYSIRSSYWFVPTIMAFGAVLLAIFTITLDREFVPDTWVQKFKLFLSNEPEGARLLLATVAGSMITIAGVVFSIVIVALSLATSQLGPRLLTNFMRDTANQIVLGIFLATFIYCILILLTINGNDGERFIPNLSISISVIIAILNLGVLIFFFHNIAASIQAPTVIARVSRDLSNTIDRILSGKDTLYGIGISENLVPVNFDANEPYHVMSQGSGYIQAIAREDLIALATEHDLAIRIKIRPGKFVRNGEVLVVAWPNERINDSLARNLASKFILGNQRTFEQDIEFGLDQLVEIAIRALSPGINDPFTAIMCIDRIGASLCTVAKKWDNSMHVCDDKCEHRLMEDPLLFEDLLDAAFNPIRQHAVSNVAVNMRMLEAIKGIGESVTSEKHANCLLQHSEMIMRGCNSSITEEQDRKRVQECYAAVIKTLS